MILNVRNKVCNKVVKDWNSSGSKTLKKYCPNDVIHKSMSTNLVISLFMNCSDGHDLRHHIIMQISKRGTFLCAEFQYVDLCVRGTFYT